ncbi:MAG: HNH endonuclease [Aridibacter sp.]
MKFSLNKRQTIEKRANDLCEYCRLPQEFSTQPFVIEHIFPVSRGGNDDLENLALACSACNNSKYNKTEAVDPQSKVIAEFYNPRKDIWSEHFAWNSEFSLTVGLTAKGRATVETLKLNRERTVNIRKFLHSVGKHPPK